MRPLSFSCTLIAALGLGLSWAPRPAAAADPEVSITLAPVRQIMVDGDKEKFRAHHWMKDGYAGGIEEFSAQATLPDGTWISTDGHALIDDNNLGAAFVIKKDALGFLKFDYDEFRKYFEGTGGVHRRFTTLQVNETDKELALDLGKFSLETGLTLEGLPELTFLYERDFKDGAKSHLTWPAVKEAGETRYIAPSWQDVDEIVDTFELRANHEIGVVALKGEQRWELVRAELFRVEPLLSTTGAAADTKIRFHDQAPEATLSTTTLGAERSFLGDTVFTALGYRFAHMDNREFETIVETNAAGVATNFSAPKQVRNARADNDYDSHIWVGSFMASPWSWLRLGTKLKAETIHRESNSTYPFDASPNSSGGSTPNGVIDSSVVSLNKNRAVRWGEGASMWLTAIPRTALYTELELEQARVILAEDRKDVVTVPNTSEDFSRYTVADVRRGTGTLGGRLDPWPFLDLTMHVRRRVNNTDYDDQRETVAAGALSAFFDGQSIHTDEFTTRTTFKPCRWFRSSVRYQFRSDKYATRAEAQSIVKTGMRSDIYTYDVVLQPLRELTTTASFSRQNATTRTPAQMASSTNIPAFSTDVNTWLFSADYSPQPNLTLNGTLQYSWADNFNDYADTGIPYGAAFDRLDFTTGVAWSPSDRTSLGVDYALYTYNPNENTDSGDYTAHAVWLKVTQTF